MMTPREVVRRTVRGHVVGATVARVLDLGTREAGGRGGGLLHRDAVDRAVDLGHRESDHRASLSHRAA